MEWTAKGLALSARRHGEGSVVVDLLTREKGRHAELLRGGFGHAQRSLREAAAPR